MSKQIQTIKLETIQFHNQSLVILKHNNKPYIAMKPICENIGLDWHAQRQRIQRHQALSKGAVMITSPSKGGDQQYLCLPISMINGWLFGIETSRVKPEIRATLEQYQLECFDVLYNHFMPKVAKQYPNTISLEQQQAIQQAVNERSYRTSETRQAIYTKLHQEFKIPRYQELPMSKFDEAILFLGGVQTRHGLSDEDWYSLAWLYKAADRMRFYIEQVEPALRILVSEKRGAFYSMSHDYKHILNRARKVIDRETMHVQPKGITDNWHKVLPVVRDRIDLQ